MPYTLVNYAAGLTPIALRAFVLATAIGVAPRAFAYTALGGSLGNLRSPEAYVAIAVLVVMAVGGLVLARRDLASLAHPADTGGMTMPRIAFVGAGSTVFTRNLVGDVLSLPSSPTRRRSR